MEAIASLGVFKYFKAFEISNKMEKFALENKNDTNAYLAKVYYYKLVLSISSLATEAE